MPKFFYTASPQSITVFVNGRQHIIGSDHSGFRALSEHLKETDHDAQFIEDCVDKAKFISRMTSGNITVQGSTVYYKGAPVHSTLATKLVQMLDMGHDATPWALFMDNLMQNPSDNSKAQLFDFLSSFNAPFTEDGCFLVFKRVRKDYKDVYSGRFDNSIGAVVEMDRDAVVDDPRQTCSAGLHVCAIHYLSSGYGSNGRTIACKVNPRDVVSVPVDYKFAKIRCCRYEVVGDVDEAGSGAQYNEATVADASFVDTTAEDPNRTAVTNGSGAVYEVAGFEIASDRDVGDGDYTYHPESGRVGKVVNEYEVKYNDHEHPDNMDWLNGALSGDEIPDMICYSVDFGDVTEDFILFEGDEDLCYASPVTVSEEEAADMVAEAMESTPMPDPVKLVSRSGVTLSFSAEHFRAKVQDLGQRGFDRQYNVPRTTVQDKLREIGE